MEKTYLVFNTEMDKQGKVKGVCILGSFSSVWKANAFAVKDAKATQQFLGKDEANKVEIVSDCSRKDFCRILLNGEIFIKWYVHEMNLNDTEDAGAVNFCDVMSECEDIKGRLHF